jgi:hypothetical protein
MTWFVEVYYDYLDDIYCDVTQYKFVSKELAEEFIKEAESIEDIFVNDVVSKHNTNLFFAMPEYYQKRPIFSTVEEALQDLNKFKNRYVYDYHYEVFKAKLFELEMRSLSSQVRKLTRLLRESQLELEKYRQDHKII